MILKPSRRRIPIVPSCHASPAPVVPMHPRRAPIAPPVRPSGDARPVTVRVVPAPPLGAALYARGANGRSEELTGRGVVSAEGDALLVAVPAWTERLTALVGGEVVADVSLARGTRPSGAVGDAITLAVAGIPRDLGAQILQGATNITRMPTATGAPADWGDPATGGEMDVYFLGATESDEPITVRVPGARSRVFGLGPVADGRARINLALRAVRWRGLPPGSRIFLTDEGGTDVTLNALPNGASVGWDGADWLSGVPRATRAVTITKPDGTVQAVVIRDVTDGEREFVVDIEAPAATPPVLWVPGTVVTPTLPSRPRNPLLNPGTLFNEIGLGGGGGGGGSTEAPGMVNVRLRGASRGVDGRPTVAVLVDGSDGTRANLADGNSARWDGADWIFGLAASVRSVRARYADGSLRDLAVPVASAGQTEVTLTLPAPSRLTVRLQHLPEGSRMYAGTRDVTGDAVTDGSGFWWLDGVGNTFAIGVPAGTRELRIVYPDALGAAPRTVTLPAPVGNIVTVDATPPRAPSAPPAYLTLRVRGAGSGDDGLPTLIVFNGDADITTGQLPDGRRAQWDGNDWLLGFPRTLRQVRVRYPSGAFGTFDLPLPTAASTEALIEVPRNVQQFVEGEPPLEIAPTSTLAFVRVWLIDPPRGTRLYRQADPPLTGTASDRETPGPEELTGYATDIAGHVALPGSGRASVPVYEIRFPDAADGSNATVAAWVMLPNGQRVEVPLAPVPANGVLRVDLSRVPGERSATVHGAGGGFGLGAVAVVGGLVAAGWAAFRSFARPRRASSVDSRSNPSTPRRGRRPARR